MSHYDSSFVDLHCHSYYSDGQLSPKALALAMSQANVQLWSLTDHDTVAGLAEAKRESDALGIDFCTGIEWSTQVGKQPIHLLAYDFDPQHEAILALQAQQTASREKRAELIAEKLVKHAKLPNLLATAKDIAGSAAVGRPHFAQAMVQQGILNDTRDAFKRWLGTGKIGDVKTPWAPVEEIIAGVKQAGGVCILAHPHKYKLSLSKLRKLTEQLAELGCEGIEMASPGFREDWAVSLVRTLDEHALCVSRGSDFHFLGGWARVNQAPNVLQQCRPWWQQRYAES
ncbi:PHP domain-containing protein [Salinibius halmophilus]|uniref:PHP domain-containing protein n=1 Tax=Salinibius halmophilus TaxID=1853216 RepID=UPI001313DB98|nr:PHP domain-containing protein [Salinibius halmophilus]